MHSRSFVKTMSSAALMMLCAMTAVVRAQNGVIDVSVNHAKVPIGQSVEITIRTAGEDVHAVLLTPGAGSRELVLNETATQNGTYTASVRIEKNAPEGLYAVHAWTGAMAKPTAVGKASFRTGNIVADFFIANYVDQKSVAA